MYVEMGQIHTIPVLEQLVITILLVIPMILTSRTVVAGSKYSPILIIVVFGLLMGFTLVKGNIATPGITELPIVILMSKVTVIALISTFFVGGQEIKKIFKREKLDVEDLILQSEDEVLLGTKSTQLVFIIRAFFILIGIDSLRKIILGTQGTDPLMSFYPILAYLGIAGAIIFIDHKAKINNKAHYIRIGIIEIAGILLVLMLSASIAQWVKPFIALPQIFFAMILSAGLGAMMSNWRYGPTLRALNFAGIPIVLAANFIVGGSLIMEAFSLTEMKAVMAFGLFGQIFWMFGGLAILIFIAKANNIRNLAPGIAGALSHSGLTGACTAGDLGTEAASRAPIMINIPFFGHVFVFSVLAASAERGMLYIGWVIPLVAIGLVFVIVAFKKLRNANGSQEKEVTGLMQFAFGYQIIAVFGSFLILAVAGMPINDSAMATSAAISHFGLFAAIQEGMFGAQSAAMIPFIFAMPFLVHPLVFGIFGKAAENDGKMPEKIVLVFAVIGVVGVIYSLFII